MLEKTKNDEKNTNNLSPNQLQFDQIIQVLEYVNKISGKVSALPDESEHSSDFDPCEVCQCAKKLNKLGDWDEFIKKFNDMKDSIIHHKIFFAILTAVIMVLGSAVGKIIIEMIFKK